MLVYVYLVVYPSIVEQVFKRARSSKTPHTTRFFRD